MKCPKCGFVSYPGLPQCKKCGHKFAFAPPVRSSSSFLSLFGNSPIEAGPAAETPPELTAPPPEPAYSIAEEPVVTSHPGEESETFLPADPKFAPIQEPEVDPTTSEESDASLPAEPEITGDAKHEEAPEPAITNHEPLLQVPAADSSEQPWREELAERLENFRQRRARQQTDSKPTQNLDLDFEKAEEVQEPESAPEEGHNVLDFPLAESPIDVELEHATASKPAEVPMLEMESAEEHTKSIDIPDDAASAPAESITFDLDEPETEPVEIVLGPAEGSEQPMVEETNDLLLPIAPLGRRFLAGVADSLVLLVGASLFALIFWRAGGHLTPGPLSYTVLGFIGAFFILVYFGLFTALTSSTPGLLWMDIEVRTLEGNHPSAKESFWRAFGYMVSIASLMLGFLWAVVDSEAMTWHDRMSGTFLTTLPHEPATHGLHYEV